MAVLRTILLAVHVASGAAGLLLAWPVLAAPKRRGGLHVRLGRIYLGAVAGMCSTALALVAFDPARLLGLAVIAVATAACAFSALWFARRRPRLRHGSWVVWHLQLMSSSVISFVTAFAVTMSDGHVLSWILPTVIGSPLIAVRAARQRTGSARPTSLAGEAGSLAPRASS